MSANERFFRQDMSLNLSMGLLKEAQTSQTQAPVLSGLFRFDDFENGLSMHVTDAVEQRDATIVSELPAGISINFLFAGAIDFALGNQQHQLALANGAECSCSLSISNQTELFSRTLKKGMHIKKLNIFVTREWLMRRCNASADQKALNALFSHLGVHRLQADEPLIAQAKTLIELNKTTTLNTKLVSEQLALTLLIQCLEKSYRQFNDQNEAANECPQPASSPLKSKVDACLFDCNALPAVAKQLNMSVSTLQRRFKQEYGLNISHYIKLRRLQQARNALVMEQLSIGEVAFASGYKYASNFIIAFKKQFGITPAAYVKLHQQH